MYRCVFLGMLVGGTLFSNVVADTTVMLGENHASVPLLSAVNVKFVIHIPPKLSLKVVNNPQGNASVESDSNISGKQVSESAEGLVVAVP